MTDERAPLPDVSDDVATDWCEIVHHFDAVGSTMDIARSLAESGAPHGTVVLAGQQLGGRGRSGRAWVSPPGNLYSTFVLRPGGGAHLSPQLGFLVAVAVAQATDDVAGPPTSLKWPNDVMREGAKLAGILLERTETGAVLAGIGVNVRHHPPAMPYAVTSLSALGCIADAAVVLAAIQAALRVEWDVWRLQGFERVLERWAARGPAIGANLLARLGEETIGGSFAGLRADGALLLDTPAGQKAIVAGDVQPCAPHST